MPSFSYIITAFIGSALCFGNVFPMDMEATLISNLLTGYDINARPVKNKSQSIVITLDIALQQLVNLNERLQELSIKVWMRHQWSDSNLVWNASQYDGISSIRIFPYRIWRPDITLYDDMTGDPSDNDVRVFPANIESDGTVYWNVPKIIISNCEINIKYYPWDEQKCTLKFGSWTYDGANLDIQNTSAKGDMDKYLTSGEWNVVAFSVKRNVVLYNCCPNPYPDLTFTLHIRRKPMYYLFNLILPAVFITATTVLVFYLPPESGEKVSLGVTVLLALTVFLLLVAESVPKSETVPLIGQYFEAIIILMALSSGLTVITLNIHFSGNFGNEVPFWIRKLVLDWMARPLCLKARIDANLSSNSQTKECTNARVVKGNQIDMLDLEKTNGKSQIVEVKRIERTGSEQTLIEILDTLRCLYDDKHENKHQEACKTDWMLVAMVIDRFLLYVFFLLTIIVTAIILTNHPNYNDPLIA